MRTSNCRAVPSLNENNAAGSGVRDSGTAVAAGEASADDRIIGTTAAMTATTRRERKFFSPFVSRLPGTWHRT